MPIISASEVNLVYIYSTTKKEVNEIGKGGKGLTMDNLYGQEWWYMPVILVSTQEAKAIT